MQEKIRCVFCGRKNHIDNDLCESCGAWLPDIPVSFITDTEQSNYLNLLVTHSAFTMSLETGRRIGIL